jgi:hypothetical protein
VRASTVIALAAAVALVGAGVVASLRARDEFAREKFVPGDRVRVSRDYHWARGATGVIRLPPPQVAGLDGDWSGHVRRVQTTQSVVTFYWVEFDRPQRDANGDGPYLGGEIDEPHLERRERR